MKPDFLHTEDIDLENVRIESFRCTIEPFHMEGVDFSDLQQAFLAANMDFYVSEIHPTVEQEREFIVEAIENRRKGKAFECFIFEKNSKKIIGSVGISDLDTQEPNIGLWIRTEYHGQGYGTEVYEALLKWAKENTNFSFFKHAVNPKNTASIRLAERFHGKLQDILDEKGHLKYYIYL